MLKEESKLSLVIALVLLTFEGLYLSPHVLVAAWRWHVMPLGLPAIGHWQAFALMLMSHLFRNNFNAKMKTESLPAAVIAVGIALAVWLGAWLAS